MKIKKFISQSRRDFVALMECEHCGEEAMNTHGYDDAYYHQKVIPAMKCQRCGKAAPRDYRPLTTKYPEGMDV